MHSLQPIVITGVRPDLHPVPLLYLASPKVRFGARRETPFNHKATLYTSPALYTAGLSCLTHLAKATRKSGSDTAATSTVTTLLGQPGLSSDTNHPWSGVAGINRLPPFRCPPAKEANEQSCLVSGTLPSSSDRLMRPVGTERSGDRSNRGSLELILAAQ